MIKMKAKYAAVIGVLGVAALGAWWNSRRSLRTGVALHIDDDKAAEIIRRARPSLERAYELILA
jgi:hypothetical protein